MRNTVRKTSTVLATLIASLTLISCSPEMLGGSSPLGSGSGSGSVRSTTSAEDDPSNSMFAEYDKGVPGATVILEQGNEVTIYISNSAWATLSSHTSLFKGDSLKGNRNKTLTRADAAWFFENGRTHRYNGATKGGPERTYSLGSFNPEARFTLVGTYVGFDPYSSSGGAIVDTSPY